jgi:all-trans-retinol dehydrogenase (NAD+)
MALQSGLRPNPLLTISAPLLLFLTKASPSLQAKILPRSLNRASITKILSISVALGIVGQISKILSAWATANWVWGKGRGAAFGEQGWEKEVAVITGGSNGIGALISKGLAEKGIRVAILDLVEPDEESKSCLVTPSIADCDYLSFCSSVVLC